MEVVGTVLSSTVAATFVTMGKVGTALTVTATSVAMEVVGTALSVAATSVTANPVVITGEA